MPASAPGRHQAEPFEPDAGLMAELAERAGEREALPILGPQGGLAATARFLTVAREMAAGLPATGWSQEVVDATRPLAAVTGPGFIATLPSLSSFRDPGAIVSGEAEGSPFPEWGSTAASTGIFAGPGGSIEGVEASRPGQGGAALRSSIIARLADRRGPDRPGTVGRTVGRSESSGRPVSSERVPTARHPAEPLGDQPAPVRRGLVSEQAAASPATPAASESLPAQPHIQRVTEFPSLDVATPVTSAEVVDGLPPAAPLRSEDNPAGLESPPGNEAAPPLQVARLAEEDSSRAAPPPTGVVPLPVESPGIPSVAGPTPTETVEMPLVTAERRPGPLVEPIAGDAGDTDRPDVVARLASVLTPAEMGVRSVAPDQSPGPPPSVAGEDATSSARAAGQEWPLAAASEPIPGAPAEPPSGSPFRTAASPGDQVSAELPTATPVQRLSVEDIGASAAQEGPTSRGPIPPASPTVGGAGEFTGDLSQPLLLTEPWAVGALDDGHQETDEGSDFGAPSPGGPEHPAGTAPPRPLRARPASVVSRGVETPSEPSRATAMPSSQTSPWDVSPRGNAPGLGEPRTGLAPGLGRLSDAGRSSSPVLRAFRPAASDEDAADVGSFDRLPVAEIENEAPGGWLGSPSQEPWGGLDLPALEMASESPTWAGPGASPAMRLSAAAREGGPTTSPVSRLADLPLARASAIMRQAEAARPESVAAEPAAGAVGTAAPASPPAAAASEGEIDKLADRVWQVVRRRLQIERERQRGLP